MAYFKILLFGLLINYCVCEVYEVITDSKNTTAEYVQIGNIIYLKEKIELGGYTSELNKIAVNSKGDIYFHNNNINVLRHGSDKYERVSGIDYKIMHDFAFDKNDNLFFVRHFYGLFAVWNGSETETSLGVHMELDAITIDVHDNIYMGAFWRVAKYDRELGDAVDLPGFSYGFVVPPAVDSQGNIYYREGYRYFYYQNIAEGEKTKRQVKGISLESALGAAVDTKDNVYVATKEGLFFIKAGSKGSKVEKVKDFSSKKIDSVFVDWRKNDTIYVYEEGSLYRLTYDRNGDNDVTSKFLLVMILATLAMLGH